jgi:DNA-binding transcriptional regulator YiaG
MVSSRQLSDKEVQQISLRMKSARMLTGLTQENFAEENGISLTSLKCWEMGRSVPRKEGALSYVNALSKNGIDISLDWIFYGGGSGPTYMSGTQIETPKGHSSYIELQINLFKKHQLSKGLNPIVTYVQDDEMLPQFKRGDLVGGYYVTIDEIRSRLSLGEILKSSWLLKLDNADFTPRFLVIGESKDHMFYCSKTDPVIRSCSILAVGQICWHYSNAEKA